MSSNPGGVKETVQRQFGAVAVRYATSAVHSGGPDLEALLDAAGLEGHERVLDVGCGAGHTTFALAPHVAEVVAVDLTMAMVEQTRRSAAERGLPNVTVLHGDVERLAQGNATFDLVTARYSAHHYPRPIEALREIRRVLSPHGTFLLVDVVAPDDLASDTFLNTIELLRDPSHVRDHTVAQWLALFAAADLSPAQLGAWPLRLDLVSWLTRMQTPAAEAAQIGRLLATASEETRRALRVEPDAFSVPTALLRGRPQ